MMLFNRPNHQSRRASISDDQSDRGGALDQRTPDGVTRHRRLSFNDSVADGVPPRPPQSPPTPSTTGPTIQTLQQQLKKATADGDKQAIQLQKVCCLCLCLLAGQMLHVAGSRCFVALAFQLIRFM